MKDYKLQLQSYCDDGKIEEAKKYLFELIKVSNDNIRAEQFYQLGKLSFYESNLDEARRFFIESLKHSFSQVYTRLYLGLIAETEEKYENALRIYSSCFKTNPELIQLNEKISNLCTKLKIENEDIGHLLDQAENKHIEHNSFPLISIIILCYNKLEYTEKSLSSVFKNTSYKNFEVIVVDNGSVDTTSAYLESWGKKIKFIITKFYVIL